MPTHVDVPNRTTCDPVVDAYRRTLGLGVLVTDLRTQFETMPLPAANVHRALADELGAD